MKNPYFDYIERLVDLYNAKESLKEQIEVIEAEFKRKTDALVKLKNDLIKDKDEEIKRYLGRCNHRDENGAMAYDFTVKSDRIRNNGKMVYKIPCKYCQKIIDIVNI